MDIITKAFETALEAHKQQKRKVSKAPYIIHPLDVSINLMKIGASTDIICAALLHDTVEDTNLKIEDIRREFGPNIARIVAGVTEKRSLKKLNNPKHTWKLRKEHTIKFMKTASEDIKLVSCSDKLSNIRAMIADIKQYGEEQVWKNFTTSKEANNWYYTSLIKSFKEGTSIEDYSIFNDLVNAVNKLFS